MGARSQVRCLFPLHLSNRGFPLPNIAKVYLFAEKNAKESAVFKTDNLKQCLKPEAPSVCFSAVLSLTCNFLSESLHRSPRVWSGFGLCEVQGAPRHMSPSSVTSEVFAPYPLLGCSFVST